MLKKQQSTPDSSQALRLLAFAILAGALVVFAGLAMVAASVLGQPGGGNWMTSVLTDRFVHYALIVAIVAGYAYVQRR